MKKLAILLASSIFALPVLAADNLQVKLEGAFDFQAAVRQQKNIEGNNLTTNQKNSAFFSQSSLRAHVSNETDYGLKYGAIIGVRTTSRTKIFPGNNGSHLYTEADFGKLELGSRQNATSLMSQGAYSICMATCDDWFRYTNMGSLYNGGYNNGGVSDYSPIYSGFGSNVNGSEQVRTATYYTPQLHGVQLGVSFSPDTANTGDNGSLTDGNGINKTNMYDKTNQYTKITARTSVKNLVGAGVTFTHNLGEAFDVTLGAGLEQGKSVITATDAEDKNAVKANKLANHKLYNVGAVVAYGNWSVAGSYADAGKSLTSDKYQWDKRKNKFYTGGLAYNQGPMGVSLTYLRNDKLQNKLDSYTLGTQYKLAPGLMPYFEATSFNVKSKGYDTSDLDNGTATSVSKKYKGTAYMFGTRVSF